MLMWSLEVLEYKRAIGMDIRICGGSGAMNYENIFQIQSPLVVVDVEVVMAVVSEW